MPRSYRDAPDVKAIAERAIADWHPHLEDATIVYLHTDPMTSRGRIVGAKIRKLGALEHHLTGIDLVLSVNEEYWEVLEEPQRVALIDHELCHARCDEGAYRLVGHDLEEFFAVARRHGPWESGIEELRGQLDLFAAGGDETPEQARIRAVGRRRERFPETACDRLRFPNAPEIALETLLGGFAGEGRKKRAGVEGRPEWGNASR